MVRFVAFFSSLAVVISFSLVLSALIMTALNRSRDSEQGNQLGEIRVLNLLHTEQVIVLRNTVNGLQENITNAFNDTSVINATIIADLAFLDNYTCDQVERINNVTPPCNGTFFLTGAGNVTVNNLPGSNQLVINGTTLQVELNIDQGIINFIMSELSITDMNLATLNVEAIKSINNVTVDPMGNINVTGQCGVDVYISNVTKHLVVDTCRIENNVTALIIQLNQTYYFILNETQAINATIISLNQLLVQLQVQLNNLKPLLVTNINGVVFPDVNNNIDFLGGAGIGTRAAVGTLTINNTGIVSVNGLQVPNVNVEAGVGIQVTRNDSVITITNTFADIFQQPCIVQSTSSVGFITYFAAPLFTGLNYPGWSAFTANTKSYPSCPDVFSVESFFQPEGLWRVSITSQIVAALTSSPCNFCGFSYTIGLQDQVTADIIWIRNFNPSLNSFDGITIIGTGSQIFISGEVLMNGYIIPPGREFKFIVYYYTQAVGISNLAWTFTNSVKAIRIA
jgi:hypothetical protein